MESFSNRHEGENTEESEPWLPHANTAKDYVGGGGDDTCNGSDGDCQRDEERPELTLGQLIRVSTGMLGLMFGWAMKTVLTTPLFRDVYGVDPANLGFVWLAGPLSGLLVQPIIGVISDHREGQGQRSIFFAAGASVMATSLALLPAAGAITRSFFGDSGHSDAGAGAGDASNATAGTGLAVFALWLLDLAMNASLVAIRSVIADCAPPRQQPKANTVILISYGGGTLLGYAFSAFDVASWLGLPSGSFWKSCVDFWAAALFLLAAAAVSTREAFRLERPQTSSLRSAVFSSLISDDDIEDHSEVISAMRTAEAETAAAAAVDVRRRLQSLSGKANVTDDGGGSSRGGDPWDTRGRVTVTPTDTAINVTEDHCDRLDRSSNHNSSSSNDHHGDSLVDAMTAARRPGRRRRRRPDGVDGLGLDVTCTSAGGQWMQRRRDQLGHGRASAEGVQVVGAEEVRDASLRARTLEMVLFYDVPSWLRPVCFLLFFSWVGWFAMIIFGSDWVGVNVFGGNPTTVSSSSGGGGGEPNEGGGNKAYEDGVAWASIGLAFQAVVVTGMGCGPVTWLVQTFGLRGGFLTAVSFQVVLLLIAVFVEPGPLGKGLSLAILGALGVPLALVESLPYMMVGMFSPRHMHGQLLGKLNVWIVLAQLALTLCVHPIVNRAKNGDASVLMAGAVAAAVGMVFVPAIAGTEKSVPQTTPLLSNPTSSQRGAEVDDEERDRTGGLSGEGLGNLTRSSSV